MTNTVAGLVVLLVCFAALTTPLQARSELSAPTATTLQEALALMDDFKGSAADFRIAIAEKVFDPAGVNEGILLKRARTRGWESDGFARALEFRVYRFREGSGQSGKAVETSTADRLLLLSSAVP